MLGNILEYLLRLENRTATIGADSLFTLIIEDNDAPPVYSFSRSKITVSESVGSVKLRINKIGGNLNQSDIILSSNPDPKYAQAGTDFTFSTQLLAFTSSDPDSLIITVPIVNDNFSEPREDAVFYIRSSFNAKIGKPDTIHVTIVDNDLPEYKISKLTNAKAPNFIPDSLNVRCAVRGVVYGINMGPVGSTQGLSFTLIDNTGGIQVYKPSGGTKGYTVAEGDSVQVYGRIAQLNGMTQMAQLDTIIKLGSGRALKSAKVVVTLNESTESDLVRFNLVKLANPSQWPSTALAANTSVTLKVLTANDSFNIVIDSETDIDGKAAPSGFFNVSGLGAQNDATSPYTSGYRMFPRRYTDFTNLLVPVFSFTSAASSAKENKDSTDGFTLQCANLTSNQQITLAIKAGTATRNVDYQSNLTRLFILTQSVPSIIVKSKLNDDATVELNETIVWVIRDNSWGTLVGADSIHTVTIIDDESNSLLENALSAKVRVYPNPASALVTVSSDEALLEQVELTDMSGRVVRTFFSEQSESIQLNIEGLDSGVYTLSVRTDRGTVVKTLSIL